MTPEQTAEHLAALIAFADDPPECLVCGDPTTDAPTCGTNHCTDRRACMQNCPWCASDAHLTGAW